MAAIAEKVFPKKKPESQEVVIEKIIEKEPETTELIPSESPIYTGDIDARGMLFNLINQILMNKASGHWIFKYKWHRRDFRDTVRMLEVAMELLDLDQRFRTDIAVAPRQPDMVEVSFAKLTACFKFINRVKLSIPEQYQETEYKPDVQDIESRELEAEEDL